MLNIIGEIERRVKLYISFYNVRPEYILLGAAQWSQFIRFFCHNEKIDLQSGQLFYDEIPVIRASAADFLEVVGGTHQIKVKENEDVQTGWPEGLRPRGHCRAPAA